MAVPVEREVQADQEVAPQEGPSAEVLEWVELWAEKPRATASAQRLACARGCVGLPRGRCGAEELDRAARLPRRRDVRVGVALDAAKYRESVAYWAGHAPIQ